MPEERKSYEGIRGWLILALIGLAISPVLTAMVVLNDLVPIFTKGHWNLLTTPGSDAYHPFWAPLILFEFVGNTAFFIFSIVLLVLFLRKSKRLPKLMICYLILNPLFVISDSFFANWIPAVAEQSNLQGVNELAMGVIRTVIWIPYFLVSKRVKQTFVR
jgi:hypothetical protein